jgi:hypothetical protein
LLFDWLKTQPERRGYNGEDELYESHELYEALNEILTGLSIEMTPTVFVNWMNRIQHLINEKRDYIS